MLLFCNHRFSIQQCMDIFGPQFNATNIQNGVDQTNTNYGGYGIASSKVSQIVYMRSFTHFLKHWHSFRNAREIFLKSFTISRA